MLLAWFDRKPKFGLVFTEKRFLVLTTGLSFFNDTFVVTHLRTEQIHRSLT